MLKEDNGRSEADCQQSSKSHWVDAVVQAATTVNNLFMKNWFRLCHVYTDMQVEFENRNEASCSTMMQRTISSYSIQFSPCQQQHTVDRRQVCDVAETVSFNPPPGIPKDDSQEVLSEVAAKLAQQMQIRMVLPPQSELQRKLPPLPHHIPKPVPPTPQNSLTVGSDGRVIPPTPPPSVQSAPSAVPLIWTDLLCIQLAAL